MKKSLSHLPPRKIKEIEEIEHIARYKKNYTITKEQLEYLAQRIKNYKN